MRRSKGRSVPRLRILFICEGKAVPATRFRVEQYVPYFERAGCECTLRYGYGYGYDRFARGRFGSAYKALCAMRKVLALRDLSRFDLVVLQRSVLIFTAVVERALRRLAVPFVFDFDDAVHLGPQGVPSRLRADTLAAVSRCATRITAGNAYLADLAGCPEKTFIVPTAIDTRRFVPFPRKPGKQVVIGWMGTSPNLAFVRAMLPDLLQVLEANPNVTFRLVSNGRLTELDGRGRIDQRKWSVGCELADLQSFDIGLMPLADDDLSRGKCAFKAIQYMAVGIPVVASRVGANVDVLDGTGAGFLVAPGDSWAPALLRLVEDSALRAQMGAAGRSRVVQRYDAEAIARDYISVFEQAAARGHAPERASRVRSLGGADGA